jgi:hypothetical protein
VYGLRQCEIEKCDDSSLIEGFRNENESETSDVGETVDLKTSFYRAFIELFGVAGKFCGLS